MIVSVHIVEPGPRGVLALMRRPPDPAAVEGLIYATTAIAAPLGEGRRPPRPNRVGMIAAWRDDAALDAFSSGHPIARRLADGWQVRLAPLRVFGEWSGMPGLADAVRPQEDDGPVAVLTLGRPRLCRLRPFLRASAPAERAAVESPAAIAITGFARPPRLVSTFSLWRDAVRMREYATSAAGAHSEAVRADRERGFHHESAFIRFRPYASQGAWGGSDPLAPA